MNSRNIDLSLLMNGNPRDFINNMDEIKYVHDKVMELRQLIWEDEATFNLRIKFEQLGLIYDNKMTNEDILKLMNSIDSKIMDARVSVRRNNNRGIGFLNENTKYENGFNTELISNRIDLSFLTGEITIDMASIEDENIEQSHNEIMKLRELIWVEAFKEFKLKLAVEGIELSSETFRREDYFEKMDELDLKLKEIKTLKKTIEKQKDGSSIYKHGQASTVALELALKNALNSNLTTKDIDATREETPIKSAEGELINDEK